MCPIGRFRRYAVSTLNYSTSARSATLLPRRQTERDLGGVDALVGGPRRAGRVFGDDMNAAGGRTSVTC